MSFHTVGYFENIAEDLLLDIQPLPDEIMAIRNNHFYPNTDWSILYVNPFAGDLLRARLVSPTYRQFSPPFITPVGSGALPTPGAFVADWRANPLTMRQFEELELDAEQDSVGAQDVFAVLGMTRNPRPAPAGNVYTMRGTSATTVTADAWTLLTMVWADTLPNGTYSVVGLRTAATTGIASRLIFPDQVERPGTPCVITEGASYLPLFLNGALGEFGRFDANRMPDVQLWSSAADTAATVYLQFVRVG